MSTPRHLRSAFAVRAALLVAAWIGLAVAADPQAGGAFAALIRGLAWAGPVIVPLALWLDWRWLNANQDAVTRFGLRRRR